MGELILWTKSSVCKLPQFVFVQSQITAPFSPIHGLPKPEQKQPRQCGSQFRRHAASFRSRFGERLHPLVKAMRAHAQPPGHLPIRQVRLRTGAFSALLAGTLSEDFIQAILTDENPLLDPMKGLRAAYPLHKRAAEMRVWIRSERLKLAMPFRDNRHSYMRECSGVVCCWARSETRKKKTIAASVAAPASDVVSLTEPSTAPTASGPTAMPSNCAAANSRATE
jgi:hypothetical protein